MEIGHPLGLIPCCNNRELESDNQGIPSSRAGNFGPFGPLLMPSIRISRFDSALCGTEVADSGIQVAINGCHARYSDTAGVGIESDGVAFETAPSDFGTATRLAVIIPLS